MYSKVPRALFIGDNPEDLRLLSSASGKEHAPTFQWGHAQTLQQGLKLLKQQSPDVILLNFSLPDSQGIETFLKVHAASPQVPIVLLTGVNDEGLAIQIVQQGAQDYLLRGQADGKLLARSLRYAIERKRAENTLSRMATFPELNPNPLLEIDPSGTLSYTNPVAQKQFPDLHSLGIKHPLLSHWDSWLKVLREKKDEVLVQKIPLGGRTYQLHVHTIPKLDVIRIYAADVTEQVRIEKLKEQFLHNVSHELRSPLAAIDQAGRLLLEGTAGECSQDQRKFLEIMLKNAAHLRAMVEDILEVTRAETGKLAIEPRRVRAARLVSETLSTLQVSPSSRGLSLTSNMPEHLPEVYADPVRLRQVLINLIDNAIKFTPQGGTISVTGQIDTDPSFLRIAVSDSGRGIPPEDVWMIFERLYQGRQDRPDGHKGLGLGLYICKQIISRHGGRIWAESRGQGSTFLFTVPIFSLAKLLQPVLDGHRPQASNLALISIEAFPPKYRLLEHELRYALLELRALLKGCIFSHDLLLPEMADPGQEGLMFVAAKTGALGAKKIVHRIRENLLRSSIIQNNRLRPKVRFSLLGLSTKAGRTLQETASEIAARIEKRVSRALQARSS